MAVSVKPQNAKALFVLMIAVIAAAAVTVGCGGKTSANIGRAPDKPAAVFWSGEIDVSWHSYEKDEFVINTAEELAGLAALVNKDSLTFQGKAITLGRDIVINDTANWLDWANNPPAHQWVAIGTCPRRVHGTFDGNGHTVSGVYIKNPEDDQGLFGVIGYYGRVSRLNVTASYIEGGDYVGILAGGSAGVIAGCSTSGIVVGDSIVGGFTGVNDGMITGSYAAGSVRGRIHVGVFLGANRIGAVIGNFSSAAGLDDSIPDEFVGANWGGFVRSTFLDTAGGVGGYFASGKGTENEPYVISAKEHLKNLSMLVNMGVSFSGKYINLDRDITLNDTANWRQWAAEPPAYVWMPIGLYINQFDGTFDGGGHIISGVYIDNPKATIISLFGAISKNAAIKNIGVTASYIRGYSVVGGLVGGSYGATISNSYATSVVTGHDAVGGLMGVSHGATIRNSYATGAVTGRGSVGGLVGNNIENSTISNSYSTGTVKGNLSVGGLVGINRESIIKFSYTISTVTGCGPRVGPLVGCICPGVENSSYFNIETSGVRDNHRGTGRTTEEMKQRETFTGWKFNRIWGMDSAINDGYPHLLGMPDNPAIRKLEAILEDVGAETDDNEK